MGKIYDELVKSLSNISDADKDRIWKELEPYSHIGPTVDDYIAAVKNEKQSIIEYFKQYLIETTPDQLIKDWEYISEYPMLNFQELLKPEYIKYINENNPSILKTYIKLLPYVDNSKM